MRTTKFFVSFLFVGVIYLSQAQAVLCSDSVLGKTTNVVQHMPHATSSVAEKIKHYQQAIFALRPPRKKLFSKKESAGIDIPSEDISLFFHDKYYWYSHLFYLVDGIQVVYSLKANSNERNQKYKEEINFTEARSHDQMRSLLDQMAAPPSSGIRIESLRLLRFPDESGYRTRFEAMSDVIFDQLKKDRTYPVWIRVAHIAKVRPLGGMSYNLGPTTSFFRGNLIHSREGWQVVYKETLERWTTVTRPISDTNIIQIKTRSSLASTID